jgi:hypothetical protein
VEGGEKYENTNKADGKGIREKRVKEIEVREFITDFLLNFSQALYYYSVYERHVVFLSINIHTCLYKYIHRNTCMFHWLLHENKQGGIL